MRVLAIVGGLAVSAACTTTPPLPLTPTPPGRMVDVLDFVLGGDESWPRVGTQMQDQLVERDRSRVCWTKYGDGSMFECWRWTDAQVYHEVDHAVDGGGGESYTFTDGRWLPRYLDRSTTWSLDLPDNRIVWFDRNCVIEPPGSRSGMSGTGQFPYTQRAWLEPARDLGPLGVREVMVLEYAPHAPGQPPKAPERYYFARGAGWFRWECTRGSATFDTPGGMPTRLRDRQCGE